MKTKLLLAVGFAFLGNGGMVSRRALDEPKLPPPVARPSITIAEIVAPGDTGKWIVTVTAAPATLSSPAPTSWHVRLLGTDTTKDAVGDYSKALLYHQFNTPRNVDTVLATLPLNFTDSVGPLSVAARGINQFGVGAFARSFTWYAKRRGTPPPPPVVGVDTLNRIAALLTLPKTANILLGSSRTFCAFQQFVNGAVAQWTAAKSSCDSIAVAYIPAAARALVSAAQQAHTDSITNTCVTWTTDTPLALGLVPTGPCSSAVVVTGLQLSMRPDQSLIRNVRWSQPSGPIVKVTPTGLVTCLRPGTGYVTATMENGTQTVAAVVCKAPLPLFLADASRE